MADWNGGWISATTSISKPFFSPSPFFQVWKDYEIATTRQKKKSLLLRLPFKQAVDKTSFFLPAVASRLGEREEDAAVTVSFRRGLNWAWQHLNEGSSFPPAALEITYESAYFNRRQTGTFAKSTAWLHQFRLKCFNTSLLHVLNKSDIFICFACFVSIWVHRWDNIAKQK